ncbi:MAG: PD-(D/E)XK nuclease family protein [Terriglobales bacterium]
MKRAAAALVASYLRHFSQELLRTWDTERPLELRVPGAGAVQGRADLILDGDTAPGHFTLVDYKTSGAGAGQRDLQDFQLAIYAAALRQSGLDPQAAYVLELGPTSPQRHSVPVDHARTQSASQRARNSMLDILAGRFAPQPDVGSCRRCDVGELCPDCHASAVAGH